MKRSCYDVGEGPALCSDKQLLSAAKLGEHSAFIELSERARPMVLRVLTRMTKNTEDAEDALQETLMKAFIHLATFDGRSSFSTWLTRIAINNAFMMLRKRRRRSEVSLGEDLENKGAHGKQYADVAPSPEYICLQNERGRDLRAAIRRLSPVLRNGIEIRLATDSSVKEIAARTGASTTATKSRLLRAQKDLTRLLSKQNGRKSAVNSASIAHEWR